MITLLISPHRPVTIFNTLCRLEPSVDTEVTCFVYVMHFLLCVATSAKGRTFFPILTFFLVLIELFLCTDKNR